MVKLELDNIQSKIQLHEVILDCLNVKLYYLKNKKFPNEYERNENKLELLKVSHRIELEKGKLAFLNSEYQLRFEQLKDE